MKLYREIADLLTAIDNCRRTNTSWLARHSQSLRELKKRLPHGAGFDAGTAILADSTPERIVMHASYHHMNDNGFYDGWTEHDVIVTPSLTDEISILVTGPNRDDIKEYIAEIFYSTLVEDVQINKIA